MQGKNRIINIRTNIFTILIFLVFGLIISRLFYLQILYGKEYKREGDNQYFYDTVENFDRGSIFFANKSGINSPAVEMTNEYDINIDPKTINLDFQKKMTEGGENIDDLKNNFYYSIQKVFDKYNSENNLLSNASNTKSFINKDIFMEKLNQKDSSFEVLEKGVEEDIANDLIGLGLRGLIIARKKSRVYFEKDIAAKILGFVGYAGDKKTGIYGIEKYYNDVLEKNAISSKNFFAEVFSDFNSDENIDKRKNLNYDNDSRGDINLTIDINLERYLDGILKNTKEK